MSSARIGKEEYSIAIDENPSGIYAATGNELIILRPDEGSFRPPFSPDGRWLVGINRDGGVGVFDGATLAEPKK